MNLGGSVKINKCGMLIVTLILLIVLYYMSFHHNTKATKFGLSSRNTNEINLRKLLMGAINAAEMGGKEVRIISESLNIHTKIKGETKEGVIDPVTDADLKSHCAMLHGLQRIFPKLKIISEEDETEIKCSDPVLFDLDPTVLNEKASTTEEYVKMDDVTVWIDPLDATKEFTEKLFEYVTTMVCVAVKGRPIIGVIHNPITQKTTWSWAHQGDRIVSDDLDKIKPMEISTKNPIFIVSRSHTGNAEKTVKEAFGENVKIINAGGAGYKVLQVVFNNATAYMHTTKIKKWDICAGNAILNALGGKMTDNKNQEINYGPNESVENENGLFASLVNHNDFIEKVLKLKK